MADWYAIKIEEAEARLIEERLNKKRFSKEELRNLKRKSRGAQHQLKIGELINKHLSPYIFNGDIAITTDRYADNILVIGPHYETVYQKLYIQNNTDDDCLTQTIGKALQDSGKFADEINYKKGYYTTNNKHQWEVTPEGVSLNLCEGGYVDIGSHRNQDHIPCTLTRNEWVMTSRSLRGLGKGSHEFAAKVLHLLMTQWENEASLYERQD